MFSFASLRSRLGKFASTPVGRVVAAVGFGVALLYGALYSLQDKLIYMPRSHNNRYYHAARQRFTKQNSMIDLAYVLPLTGVAQTAYYLPHRTSLRSSAAAPIWLFFGGNAMVRRQHLSFVCTWSYSAADSRKFV